MDATTHLRGIPLADVTQAELENAMARTYDRWAETNALANHNPTKFMDRASELLDRYNALRAEYDKRANA